MNEQLPPLYDPLSEHDSCGLGFIADAAGRKSNSLFKNGLKILKNLHHRGASGHESETGDGAGILLQMPHKFLEKVCKESNIFLPEEGYYGVGLVFLPTNLIDENQCEQTVESVIQGERLELLGWRTVPTTLANIGPTARESAPYFRQLFVGGFEKKHTPLEIERKLFIVRKLIEKKISKSIKDFYIVSLSSRTLVYKGMVTALQLDVLYSDLKDPDIETALALVHTRFSTNTLPSWPLSHPFRFLSHNGEINTLRGNINRMRARESMFFLEDFPDLDKISAFFEEGLSDSASLDNAIELLTLSGRDLAHAMLMLIPEPWTDNPHLDDERKAFYAYHNCLMEPWDGPLCAAFSDGDQIGAILDRNGLRPARYTITNDNLVIMASETGVLHIPPENIKEKGRVGPGQMILIDTKRNEILKNRDIKIRYARVHPYQKWLDKYRVMFDDIPPVKKKVKSDEHSLFTQQQVFGYTQEEIRFFLIAMAQNGDDPVSSMGNDAALAALSNKPRLLYDYFKQLFAQVTNPAIDAFRETIVTQQVVTIGGEENLLEPKPSSCKTVQLESPILTIAELEKIKTLKNYGFPSKTLSLLFCKDGNIEERLVQLCDEAKQAISDGVKILILSDRGVSKSHAPIPMLLGASSLHHYLIETGLRMKVSLVVESAEARQVHHIALLISFGIAAVNPYLAMETIESLQIKNGISQYIKALEKGLLKVISKMGISTIHSYCGAQVFEAIGLNKELIEKYFRWTPSKIEGVGIDIIAKESLIRHQKAFFCRNSSYPALDIGGDIQWKRNGTYHLFNPETVETLQHSTSTNRFDIFKQYSNKVDDQKKNPVTLRSLLEFKWAEEPVPLEEVESAEEIMKRFCTSGMSYGALSQEAHETLSIAMNRINGSSNSGEGGEDPKRYTIDENGDLRRSSVHQIASGRFGVTSEYLVNCDALQIKIAQGAKPGEGGQLPGHKVYPWIAKTRFSTPGVELISPPPHHDIYSIEDLAQLIFDLKNSNPKAEIQVKLVSEYGVGTIAAGVVKAKADAILISGHDGGTGASPLTSMLYAGTPWEIGLAETQQTLVLNGFRDRIRIQVDGQIKTGRDVVIAALLGADEYGFGTAPLVVLGCIMMRVCHLNTCPVGVATQDPELRKKFTGKAENLINYFRFIAEEVRGILSRLGFRKIDEIIGHIDRLRVDRAIKHWKTEGLDFSGILHRPFSQSFPKLRQTKKQNHHLEDTLDQTVLIPSSKDALENKTPVTLTLPIQNSDRSVGTTLGYSVTKRYGGSGLPDDTITLNFTGSAGQSFGAFIPKGITLSLEGDANDYLGKGLSGGKIIVFPSKKARFVAHENIIVGNVILYGATSGHVYINGLATERFCVRNSGAKAVVEGVGDHGCEYMTGGIVVVLGGTGKNFGAGMTGGIAYVLNQDGTFPSLCNLDTVDLEVLNEEDKIIVKGMIEDHVHYTDSFIGKEILQNCKKYFEHMIKVYPRAYKQALKILELAEKKGISWEKAYKEVNG